MAIKRSDLAAWQPKTEEVDAHELGEGLTVLVRELSAKGGIETSMDAGDNPERAAIQLFQMCAVDEDGATLYGPDELQAIEQLPMTLVTRVAEAAAELSGMGQDSLEAAEGN